MDYILKIENLTKHYPGVKALNEVSLAIKSGEVHALVGENGAGKSTLIKVLAGVIKPDQGRIIIEGKDEKLLNPLDSLHKGIAVSFQDINLFPNLSIAENIALRRQIEEKNFLLKWRNIKLLAQDAIKELGLEVNLGQKLGYLSVANQQLVAIARALVHNAKLLILDEPTSSLSKEDVDKLFNAINILKEKGMAIIFVSHKLDEIFDISDEITVLRDGNYIGTYIKDTINEEQLISFMVGRNIQYRQYEAQPREEELLKVSNLSKRGNFKDISFTLHRGEVLGITGLVGAGRTEVAQALFGYNLPDEGKIFIEGEMVKINSTLKAVELGIGYISENRKTEGLILEKSMEDNLTITIIDRLLNKFKMIDFKEKRKVVTDWVEKLKITPPYPDMLVNQFSGGNQQKVVIAKWLSYNPRVLIIDEPTNGIDIGAKSEIHQLLKNLAEQGMGIIVISSEIPEILAISDRILIMRRGRIVCELNGNRYTQKDILSRAF
jgi:ABC-type sugar transport system ATPase subunit